MVPVSGFEVPVWSPVWVVWLVFLVSVFGWMFSVWVLMVWVMSQRTADLGASLGFRVCCFFLVRLFGYLLCCCAGFVQFLFVFLVLVCFACLVDGVCFRARDCGSACLRCV